MADRANPAFAGVVVAVPILALVAALAVDYLPALIYVHVMAGVLWTGVDVFMGAVIGPVIGGLDVDSKAEFFEKFTPKMTFLMPVLAIVTVAAGINVAIRMGKFPTAEAWLPLFSTAITVPSVALIAWQFDALRDWRALAILGVAVVGHAAWIATTVSAFAMARPEILFALAVVTLISIQGFGIVLPGEVRMYRQMTSPNPDKELIGAIGMRNAKLGGLQGAMQLVLIVTMVLLRVPGGL